MIFTFSGDFSGGFVIFAFTAVLPFILLSHSRDNQDAVGAISADDESAARFDFFAVMLPKDITCGFVEGAGKGHGAFYYCRYRLQWHHKF